MTVKPIESSLQDKINLDKLHPVKGFTTVGFSAGIRKSGRPDLAIIASAYDCKYAGVFTTNQVKAAPVLLNIERLQNHAGRIRAVVINSGNANACTGPQGMKNAQKMAEITAQELGCHAEQILVLSTGVIGVQLPMDILEAGIPQAVTQLHADHWVETARAIMTTDTRPKGVSHVYDGYTITGIAKGSGMISPNMATMLAIITTDAAISQSLLQSALYRATNVSFNRISVDGDTSTNDSVLVLANGSSNTVIEKDQGYDTFVQHLTEVCTKLAHMIVRDGEGATRFITINVTGAADERSAQTIANTIANSPLVKTAFYGGDANWGRIMMAAGRAGIHFDQSRLSLWFAASELPQSKLQIVAQGVPTNYREEDAAAIFAQQEITVQLDLGIGKAESTVWTCDLSHAYVSINGDYRT